MTDLREKLAEEIEAAMDNVHDMDVTFRQYAEAASAAIIDALPGLVKPLQWVSLGDKWGTVTCGKVQITQKGCAPYWDLSCSSAEIDGYFDTLEAAKAAAQADYTRRILAAFGIAEDSE